MKFVKHTDERMAFLTIQWDAAFATVLHFKEISLIFKNDIMS